MGNHVIGIFAALGRLGPRSPQLDAASRVSTEGLFMMFYFLLHTSCGKQEITNVFISRECCSMSAY